MDDVKLLVGKLLPPTENDSKLLLNPGKSGNRELEPSELEFSELEPSELEFVF